MRITAQQIRRAVPDVSKANIDAFVNTFNEWSDRFGINTNKRVIHFLSQVCTESGAFKFTEENLNYSADGLMKTWPTRFKTREFASRYARQPEKIANYVYANRMGNGNEASGDGWRYKGRGFIMITGRDGYQSYAGSEFCVGDLMSHPEWLAKSPGCTKSAMWYWWKNNLSDIADRDDGGAIGEEIVTQITKKVNGGYIGLQTRLFYYRRFRKEFGI